MEQIEFSVFCDDGSAYTSGNPERPRTLDGLIEEAMADGECPIAWAAEALASWGGTKTSETLLAESLAAGRLIERQDGKYVARGVEPVDPWKAALDKLEAGYAAQAQRIEPLRPALTWNAKTDFDAFPGFSVFSDTADAPGYTGSLPTSDTASHQVTPKFGSSDLA